MKPGYNPFEQPLIIETEFGNINTLERRYCTHRNEGHIFKKYRAFGISLTELEGMRKYAIREIIIRYQGKKSNIIYRIMTNMLQYFKHYDNKGDEQILIPLAELEKIGEEKL